MFSRIFTIYGFIGQVRRIHFSLLLSLTAFIFINLNGQSYPLVPADMTDYNSEMTSIAKTGVTKRTDWLYTLHDGNVTAQRTKERELNFDDLGRIKEIITIDRQGYNQSIIVFRYDSRNLPSLETEFLPTGELIGKTKYSYGATGRIKEITWLNSYEFIIKKIVYEVSDSEQSITERQFYSPDSVINRTVYFYTNLNNGFLSKKLIYEGENKLKNIVLITRNEKNMLIDEEFRNIENKLMVHLAYYYDCYGNLINVMALYPNGTKVKKDEYQYDEDKLITGKIEYSQQGEILKYQKYSYE